MAQNGFVQFDIRNNETTRPDQEGRLFFGGFSNTGAIPDHPVVYRSTATATGSNNTTFYRRTTISGIYAAVDTAINIYDGNFHTIRIEWLNYVISGVRTMKINLYIDGTLTTTTVGGSDTAWAVPPKLIFIQGRNIMISASSQFRCNSNYKNISMGVPALPAGAIAAQY
jgi:hypothetical protein